MSTKLTKETANQILKEFSKELRKTTGKADVDIIIVGGGSILLNYNFRTMTDDFDIIKPHKLLDISSAKNKIKDKYNLSNDWFNDDFLKTDSYTPRLLEHCDYYCTYSNHIHFYTIKDEYLIAMKLKSSRNYKRDISDIIGILNENPYITFDKIVKAYNQLYDEMDMNTVSMLKRFIAIPKDNLDVLYKDIVEEESSIKDIIIQDGLIERENIPYINLNEIINKSSNLTSSDSESDFSEETE
ncbi:MAG: DUF6036 family nucleotidyltransferase [Erysipelotrichaceae bacterium]|nr:DUF6036 family nucleotidyltransferase [Erysipelotrichaceae bacterium]